MMIAAYTLLIGLLLPAAAPAAPGAQPEETFHADVPIRAITHGPKAHWFGYYDKQQFDATGRYVLGMEVEFEDRAPTPGETVRIGMIDLQNGDQWIALGESRAWSWQQGCMLQWRPGTDRQIIYNDCEEDHFVARIKDVVTGDTRTLPRPIYAVDPSGKHAVGTNFARIDSTRPGYGYKGVTDPGAGEAHPANDGIYTMNLDTGDWELIISYDQIAQIPQETKTDGKHWFNHLLFNPSGTRFVFLHRAYPTWDAPSRFVTRMFTANADGSGLACLADHTMVSHFIWKDDRHILAWSKEPPDDTHFHLYTDQSDEAATVGQDLLTHDGHCTYSPDTRWILTDGYPDRQRMQPLMLMRTADAKVCPLGKFLLPQPPSTDLRCDLHPRWSRDGNAICIDSAHDNGVRQMYLLDVRGITETAK